MTNIHLPIPTPEAQNHSAKLVAYIKEKLKVTDPFISFPEYMDLVLYTPKLGYYRTALPKFGAQGDFVTAPEISNLFGICIAKQVMEVFTQLDEENIFEFGAGTGKLALDILQSLSQNDHVLKNYYILELSQALKTRQHHLLKKNLPPAVFEKIIWLNTLPEKPISAVVIANEVLDAMPVARYAWDGLELREIGITLFENQLLPATCVLDDDDIPDYIQTFYRTLPAPYEVEFHPYTQAWLNALSMTLTQAVVLLIDYGLPFQAFFHPDRGCGTVRCHYQHHVHNDVLFFPGLQDITAHVNFSHVAKAASNAGFSTAGFTSQALFLMSLGITGKLAQIPESMRMQQTAAASRLLHPNEMGEAFKVLALTKNYDHPLQGFSIRDFQHQL